MQPFGASHRISPVRHSRFRRTERPTRKNLPGILPSHLAAHWVADFWSARALRLPSHIGGAFPGTRGDAESDEEGWLCRSILDSVYVRDCRALLGQEVRAGYCRASCGSRIHGTVSRKCTSWADNADRARKLGSSRTLKKRTQFVDVVRAHVSHYKVPEAFLTPGLHIE